MLILVGRRLIPVALLFFSNMILAQPQPLPTRRPTVPPPPTAAPPTPAPTWTPTMVPIRTPTAVSTATPVGPTPVPTLTPTVTPTFPVSFPTPSGTPVLSVRAQLRFKASATGDPAMFYLDYRVGGGGWKAVPISGEILEWIGPEDVLELRKTDATTTSIRRFRLAVGAILVPER